jgi:hypothetical protein
LYIYKSIFPPRLLIIYLSFVIRLPIDIISYLSLYTVKLYKYIITYIGVNNLYYLEKCISFYPVWDHWFIFYLFNINSIVGIVNDIFFLLEHQLSLQLNIIASIKLLCYIQKTNTSLPIEFDLSSLSNYKHINPFRLHMFIRKAFKAYLKFCLDEIYYLCVDSYIKLHILYVKDSWIPLQLFTFPVTISMISLNTLEPYSSSTNPLNPALPISMSISTTFTDSMPHLVSFIIILGNSNRSKTS